MLVAHPKHVYGFDFVSLSRDYMSGKSFSRIFIPILIFVDILIALFVGHYKTSQTRFAIIIVTMVLYVLLSIVPEVNPAMVANIPAETAAADDAPVIIKSNTPVIKSNTPVVIFIFLMFFLLAIRTISFYDENRKPPKFVEIDT